MQSGDASRMKVKLSDVIDAIAFSDQYSTYFLDAVT